MVSQWSASGLDLHVALDRRHVGQSLEHALRSAARIGQLPPGSALPSSRALAADLGVARNTVVEVYGQLVAEGWLTARPGSKTRVADRGQPAPTSVDPGLSRWLRPPVVPLDLRPGSPDLTAFPRREWQSASRRALQAATPDAFAYGDPRGLPQLRRELAAYLARARGVDTSPEHIVVCLGITHGLALIAKVLRDRGATSWAVEEHGLPLSASVAAGAGFELQHLVVDHHGADVSALTRADAVYLTPAHQFPMGVPLSADRRTAVTAWAREQSHLVIEDDYDGEYRYDRQPVGALQALDPDHVVYLGTTSKSLAPALRLGWLVAPPQLLRELVEARTLAFGYNSSLDQLTLAELFRTGVYDRLLRSSRARYRRRRQQLVEALRLPSIEIEGAEAGLHALVRLPRGVDETQVVGRARQSGLAVEGLGQYTSAAGNHRAALVIGFGAATEDSYGRCLSVLADVLRSVT